jgi:hypothetical protein
MHVVDREGQVTVELAYQEAQALSVILHEWWSRAAEDRPDDERTRLAGALCGELNSVSAGKAS